MGCVAIRAKHEVLAVAREHWKRIEHTAMRDLLEMRAVLFDHKEIELAVLRILEIRGEDDPLAIRMEVRREARTVQMRYLPLVRAIGIHHP